MDVIKPERPIVKAAERKLAEFYDVLWKCYSEDLPTVSAFVRSVSRGEAGLAGLSHTGIGEPIVDGERKTLLRAQSDALCFMRLLSDEERKTLIKTFSRVMTSE